MSDDMTIQAIFTQCGVCYQGIVMVDGELKSKNAILATDPRGQAVFQFHTDDCPHKDEFQEPWHWAIDRAMGP